MRNKVLIVSAATLAGVVCVSALLLAAGETEAIETSSPVESLSVLSSVDSTAEVVPEKAAPWLSSIQNPMLGGGEVREVGVARLPGGDEVVVAAAGESICSLDVRTGGSNCGQADRVASGSIFTATPNGCEGYTVMGLMPDGVSNLTVDSEGRADGMSIPVVSNVYKADLPPVDATLASDGVKVHVPLAWYAADRGPC